MMSFKVNRESSFKHQLLAFFVLSVGFLVLTNSIVTSWQTNRIVGESKIKTGTQLAENLASQSVLGLLTDSKENSQDAIDAALAFHAVTAVVILHTNGEPLLVEAKDADYDFYLGFAEQLKSRQYFSKARLYHEVDSDWFFTAPVFYHRDADDIATVQPMSHPIDEQILGFVLIKYNKRDLAELKDSIFLFNLLIGGGGAFVLAFIMNWGIIRLTRPVEQLAKTMQSSTKDNLYPLAELEGAIEFQGIADSYNELMLALEWQNIELERYKDTLESEVELRTQELLVARDTALSASRHKSEFLANISHELRTPLQAIIGYNDLVREELEILRMDSLVGDLNTSMRSAHHLLNLINNILDIAKIEAGRMDLFVKPVDLILLINEAIETIKPIATAHQNKLVVKQKIALRTVNVDRQKLMQIFLNLLSNASKFTKKGKIIFEIESKIDNLSFSVSDNGIGIPEAEMVTIFDPFTQVDGQQTRQVGGTGLGMAITKNFCDLMSAEITVTSELGLGSCFSVSIPLDSHGDS